MAVLGARAVSEQKMPVIEQGEIHIHPVIEQKPECVRVTERDGAGRIPEWIKRPLRSDV